MGATIRNLVDHQHCVARRSVLSLYVLSVAPARSQLRRGVLIALAVTGPMLWGPALLEVFGTSFLKADAILVSTLIGTDRVGNIFSGAIGADGAPTHFAIYPPCSSLHGMSIAVLAWITISKRLEVLGQRDILFAASSQPPRCSL